MYIDALLIRTYGHGRSTREPFRMVMMSLSSILIDCRSSEVVFNYLLYCVLVHILFN